LVIGPIAGNKKCKKKPVQFARAFFDLKRLYEALPILNIFVPQTGQEPWVAGRPFFIVICSGFDISRLVLHFMQ